jgi:deoxyribose-phosphate aldolase
MYIEYACLDYSLTEIETQSNIEYAIKNGINNIALHPYSITSTKNLHPNINISCQLDYPYGLSDIKSRNFMVTQACKSGASTIDIVSPNKILTNRKYDKFREDIRSNLEICKEHSVSLRYILEYRVFSHEVLAKVCQILKTLEINTVLPSSGIFLDDINDNLIVCNFLNTKSGINVICNGNIYTAKHIQNTMLSTNNGLRLYYKNSIDLYNQYVAIK